MQTYTMYNSGLQYAVDDAFLWFLRCRQCCPRAAEHLCLSLSVCLKPDRFTCSICLLEGDEWPVGAVGCVRPPQV